jgi:hypothetical protein
VGPCHNGMMQLFVVDGGDRLQIWRVAANILHKQSWTADKGGSPARGLDKGLHLCSIRNQLVTECYTEPWNQTNCLE